MVAGLSQGGAPFFAVTQALSPSGVFQRRQKMSIRWLLPQDPVSSLQALKSQSHDGAGNAEQGSGEGGVKFTDFSRSLGFVPEGVHFSAGGLGGDFPRSRAALFRGVCWKRDSNRRQRSAQRFLRVRFHHRRDSPTEQQIPSSCSTRSGHAGFHRLRSSSSSSRTGEHDLRPANRSRRRRPYRSAELRPDQRRQGTERPDGGFAGDSPLLAPSAWIPLPFFTTSREQERRRHRTSGDGGGELVGDGIANLREVETSSRARCGTGSALKQEVASSSL